MAFYEKNLASARSQNLHFHVHFPRWVHEEEKHHENLEKTRLQNLIRHKSGRQYARLFLNGKEIWKSLKTSHFSVAEARLGALQKEHRAQLGKNIDTADAKMTFGQAAEAHMERVAKSVTIKRRTRLYQTL